MATRSADGRRWVEILQTLRPELPGTWSLRGSGLRSVLVREPIEWTIPWIGGSKASSMRMHAGVVPVVASNLNWSMGRFGLDMSEVSGGPGAITLGADDDEAVAREFVRHALARIEELSPEHYARQAETWVRREREGPTRDSTEILMAPGWRILTGNADPLDAVEACRLYVDRRWPEGSEARPDLLAFLDDVASAWSDGRDAALAWFAARRDAHLAESGFGEPR